MSSVAENHSNCALTYYDHSTETSAKKRDDNYRNINDRLSFLSKRIDKNISSLVDQFIHDSEQTLPEISNKIQSFGEQTSMIAHLYKTINNFFKDEISDRHAKVLNGEIDKIVYEVDQTLEIPNFRKLTAEINQEPLLLAELFEKTNQKIDLQDDRINTEQFHPFQIALNQMDSLSLGNFCDSMDMNEYNISPCLSSFSHLSI